MEVRKERKKIRGGEELDSRSVDPVGDTYSVRGRRNCFGDATPLLRGWRNNVPGGFPLATTLYSGAVLQSMDEHYSNGNNN